MHQEITYIKKEKFRSAEGLCSKEPEAFANKSSRFGSKLPLSYQNQAKTDRF
jgi:hypothetical protein